MGLAVTHGIVENHDGRVIVESEVDKGTVFTVYLPVIEGYAPAQQYPYADLPSGKERILLVDDESHIVNTTGQLLQRLGYSVWPFVSDQFSAIY